LNFSLACSFIKEPVSAGKGEFALLSRKCKPCFSQQGHSKSKRMFLTCAVLIKSLARLPPGAALSSSVPGPDEFDRPPDYFARTVVVIEDIERVTTGGVIAEFKRQVVRYRLLRETVERPV
jgi:hypothetical protein